MRSLQPDNRINEGGGLSVTTAREDGVLIKVRVKVVSLTFPLTTKRKYASMYI